MAMERRAGDSDSAQEHSRAVTQDPVGTAIVRQRFAGHHPHHLVQAAALAIRPNTPVRNVDASIDATLGAEDFSFMLQERPGCFAFIGNGDGDHREQGHGLGPCMLHNPSYDFNDELLPLGATYWVRLVERYLERG
ncbi:hypothetical protein VZ52_06995 [Ralstonia mannitolilytica]|nr:hypothetical protein VZ52_06995 [Ralstonia mannitolilytica]